MSETQSEKDSKRLDVLLHWLPFSLRHQLGGDPQECRIGIDALADLGVMLDESLRPLTLDESIEARALRRQISADPKLLEAIRFEWERRDSDSWAWAAIEDAFNLIPKPAEP